MIGLLRPWLAALGLFACAIGWFTAFAWSVQFDPPALLAGLGDAADGMRLPAMAVTLHMRAAELHRAHVRRMRETQAPGAERRDVRFALADRLRSAALIMHRSGDATAAASLLTEALQAAPERTELRSQLVDITTRETSLGQRRVELLRLVHSHADPLAFFLVGQSFIEEGNDEAAAGYLSRAAERSPRWAEAHLELARLHLRAGDLDDSAEHAAIALAEADDLTQRLAAATLARRAGAWAPPQHQIIAQFALARYQGVALLLAAFTVLLFSPALVTLATNAVGRLRGLLQRSISDSAS